MKRVNRFALVSSAIAITAAVGLVTSLAGAQQQQAPPAAGNAAGDMGQRLIEGLRATDGCLGVENCQMGQSGKFAIIAWFENKAAVLRWYTSPTHSFLLRAFGGDPANHKPLEHITDENTPIMVMASMTMVGKPIAPGGFPASQFSVELYAPLPGGAEINGRLAPKDFKIPNIKNYDDAPAAAN
jgi:hypothetical protein